MGQAENDRIRQTIGRLGIKMVQIAGGHAVQIIDTPPDECCLILGPLGTPYTWTAARDKMTEVAGKLGMLPRVPENNRPTTTGATTRYDTGLSELVRMRSKSRALCSSDSCNTRWMCARYVSSSPTKAVGDFAPRPVKGIIEYCPGWIGCDDPDPADPATSDAELCKSPASDFCSPGRYCAQFPHISLLLRTWLDAPDRA